MSVENLVGVVDLRNRRRVYRMHDGMRVVQEGRRGEEYAQIISTNVIDFAYQTLLGQEVDVEVVTDVLAEAPTAFNLPYTYGHKLGFYAQDVLICLVALGLANYEKRGHRYYYQINGD